MCCLEVRVVDLAVCFPILQITTATLDRFLLAVEEGYKKFNNPYHNECHATDVTHSVHYFLSRVGLMVSRFY